MATEAAPALEPLHRAAGPFTETIAVLGHACLNALAALHMARGLERFSAR